MARGGWVLGILALATACLDSPAYGPLGFHCDSAADCPGETFCFRQRCAALTPEPPKPTAETTGVPPDTTLTLSGALSVTEDGKVLEALDIEGCVEIRAKNVSILRSRIRCNREFGIRQFSGSTGLLVEDTEIDGTGNTSEIGFPFGSGIGRRLNIHGVRKGAMLGNDARLEASYVHDLVGSDPTGIGSDGGGNISVFGNAVEAPKTGGTAIYLSGGGSLALTAVRIERNWMNGGQYILRLGGGGSGASDVSASHNRFGRDFVTKPIFLEAGAVAFENVYDDTGEAVTP